jgi:diguanylate cyclase (GGDEF)-like protein
MLIKRVPYAVIAGLYLMFYGAWKVLCGESLHEILGYKDTLTKVFNRKAFFKHIKTFKGGGLIMLDIDKFKDYNDKYGHPSGDELLINVTKHVEKAVKSNGILYRMGGDEFFVLCPGKQSNDIKSIAENIRETIGSYSQISVSVGSITTPVVNHPFKHITTGDTDLMIKQVDRFMYQAKANGRNVAYHGNFNVAEIERC